MKNKLIKFDFLYLALDESCDICNAVQLHIFVCGLTKTFEITEELAAMPSVKRSMTGSDFFVEVTACMDRLWLVEKMGMLIKQ